MSDEVRNAIQTLRRFGHTDVARMLAELCAENERLLDRIDALCAESVKHWSEAERLGAVLGTARSLAELQAEDEGLWCPAVTATEAYLQQELRRLHAAVEGER